MFLTFEKWVFFFKYAQCLLKKNPSVQQDMLSSPFFRQEYKTVPTYTLFVGCCVNPSGSRVMNILLLWVIKWRMSVVLFCWMLYKKFCASVCEWKNVDVCTFSIWVRWGGDVENLQYHIEHDKKGEMWCLKSDFIWVY